MEHNYYAILNVSQTASTQEIQRAYKRLSRYFHPDKVGQSKSEAEENFVIIKQAHDVLMDPVYRLAYDQGGHIAIRLIKRSIDEKHSHQAKSNQRSSEMLDLYEEIQRSTKDQAILLVKQVVQDHDRITKQIKAINWKISSESAYAFHRNSLSRDSQSIEVTTVHPVNDKLDCSMTHSFQLHRTASTNHSSRISLDYRPIRNTQCAADFSISPGQVPNLSFRTSRRLANSTFVMVALGGSTKSKDPWVGSLISSRTLLLDRKRGNAENNDTTRVQATWRMGMKTDGTLQIIMATLRNLGMPQWKIRLALGSSPLKLGYKLNDTVSASWAWNISSSSFKIAIDEHLLADWNMKYSLKYNGPSALWSIVARIYNEDWNLKFPILISRFNESPVSLMMTLIIGHFVESLLDDMMTPVKSSVQSVSDGSPSGPYVFLRKNINIIGRIASRKRRLEDKERGLVVLQAQWRQANQNVADILQYWVSESCLEIDAATTRWWEDELSSDQPQKKSNPWWKFWRYRDQMIQESPSPSDSLYIRYKFQGSVYECTFSLRETIILPTSRATNLGASDRIQ